MIKHNILISNVQVQLIIIRPLLISDERIETGKTFSIISKNTNPATTKFKYYKQNTNKTIFKLGKKQFLWRALNFYIGT